MRNNAIVRAQQTVAAIVAASVEEAAVLGTDNSEMLAVLASIEEVTLNLRFVDQAIEQIEGMFDAVEEIAGIMATIEEQDITPTLIHMHGSVLIGQPEDGIVGIAPSAADKDKAATLGELDKSKKNFLAQAKELVKKFIDAIINLVMSVVNNRKMLELRLAANLKRVGGYKKTVLKTTTGKDDKDLITLKLSSPYGKAAKKELGSLIAESDKIANAIVGDSFKGDDKDVIAFVKTDFAALTAKYTELSEVQIPAITKYKDANGVAVFRDIPTIIDTAREVLANAGADIAMMEKIVATLKRFKSITEKSVSEGSEGVEVTDAIRAVSKLVSLRTKLIINSMSQANSVLGLVVEDKPAKEETPKKED